MCVGVFSDVFLNASWHCRIVFCYYRYIAGRGERERVCVCERQSVRVCLLLRYVYESTVAMQHCVFLLMVERESVCERVGVSV